MMATIDAGIDHEEAGRALVIARRQSRHECDALVHHVAEPDHEYVSSQLLARGSIFNA